MMWATMGFDDYFGIPYPNDHSPQRLSNTGSLGHPPIKLMHNAQIVKSIENYEYYFNIGKHLC